MVAEVDCGNLTQCARAAMCIVVCSSVYSGVLCIVLCIRIVVYNFCFLFLVCLDLCLYLVQGFFGQWCLLCLFSLYQYILSFPCVVKFLSFVFSLFFLSFCLVSFSCVFKCCARVSPRSGSAQHAATHLGKHRSDRGGGGVPCSATTYVTYMCVRLVHMPG